MEDYIASVHELFYTRKSMLPGNCINCEFFVDRLTSGAAILSELADELNQYAESFRLENEPLTKEENRLLVIINKDMIAHFIKCL